MRRGEMALRSKPIPNPVKQKGSPGEVIVYLEDDATTILAGAESEHPGMGRGQNAARLRDANLAKAKKVAVEILRERGELAMGSLRRLVQERAHLSEGVVRRAITLVTVERVEAQNKRFRRLHPDLATPAEDNTPAPAPKSNHGAINPRLPAEQPAPNGNGETAPPAPSRRGRPRKEATWKMKEFCYIEYRLKKRKRPNVHRDAKRFNERAAPKRGKHVALLADRFADKCRIPRRPSDDEIPDLLRWAQAGELVPIDE